MEPWDTAFLRGVHFLARQRWMRRLSARVDAFQRMVENEIETYDRRLASPDELLALLLRFFAPVKQEIRWGKFQFIGAPRAEASRRAPGPASR